MTIWDGSGATAFATVDTARKQQHLRVQSLRREGKSRQASNILSHKSSREFLCDSPRYFYPARQSLAHIRQAAHSRKIGVQMVASSNLWRTPWHASVLFDGKNHSLVRRADAEAMGAVLVKANDRYAFFALPGALTGGTTDVVTRAN